MQARQDGREDEGGSARIFVDVSTSLRWSGPPVGIVRVEQELARWALANLPEAQPVFFDPNSFEYRALDRGLANRFLCGKAVLDTLDLRDPGRRQRRKSDRIPAVFRPFTRWVLQFRRRAFQALERRRLSAGNNARARLYERLQTPLVRAKDRALIYQPGGERRDYYPPDLLRTQPIELRDDDVLFCAGVGWTHSDFASIVRRKQETPFRLALFCYDIIPIMFPQFYYHDDAEALRRYVDAVFPIADLILFSSRRVEADVQAYAARSGFMLKQTAVVPLGADIRNAGPEQEALPAGLQHGRFALFVSTIEPRKGHRLLYETWLRLLAEGVPQAADFKLVFVGRPGWLVEDLTDALDTDPRVRGSVLRLHGVDDATMRALYRGAAFCCYPSLYEGYGLPLVEAFSFGKAVLASNRGSLPEVAGEFSPCLDPEDPEIWYRTMRSWIEDPSAHAPYEERIRTSFRHPTWDEAAGFTYRHIRELATAPAGAARAASADL